MKANYTINAGDLSVIRPLVYCREGQMTDFAKGANLPVINENCPACFEEPKERARIKKLLLRESTLYPNLYDNLRRAMIPIMKDETSAILRCYTEEAVAKSRGKSHLPSADCVPNTVQVTDSTDDLAKFSDEDLLKEVARRKAMQYSQYGAMKRFVDDDQPMHTDLSSEFGNNYQMDNH
jgi:tRNA(Ile)-lysidine synthase TilS/MesJ